MQLKHSFSRCFSSGRSCSSHMWHFPSRRLSSRSHSSNISLFASDIFLLWPFQFSPHPIRHIHRLLVPRISFRSSLLQIPFPLLHRPGHHADSNVDPLRINRQHVHLVRRFCFYKNVVITMDGETELAPHLNLDAGLQECFVIKEVF